MVRISHYSILRCKIHTTLPLYANFWDFHPYPPQSQASEPHFFAPLCLRPEEALPQLPRAVIELPLCEPRYMHPHIYLILPLNADTIQGAQLPHLWPLLKFQLGVLLQRRPRLQSQESPLEQLEIHSLSLLPPNALSSPARPLRATPIAEREHSMTRHILVTMFCDSSPSWGIHTAYVRESLTIRRYHFLPFYYHLLLEHWGQCSS